MDKTKIAALVGSALLICAAESQAAINWAYGGATNESSTVGNTVASSAGGVTATGQAWANTNDGTSGSSNAALGSNTLAGSASYKLETAYLNIYSGGLVVKNQDTSTTSLYGDLNDGVSPEHAIDNNQRYDSVLFSFTKAVNLTAMTTGYVSTDSDFTVWYYAGLGAPSLTGKTYGALGAGWILLGSNNGGSTPGTTSISNSTGIFSSYWLIGAYNDVVSSGQSAGNDYFKISGLTGTPCAPGIPGCGGGPSGAPEPGTLLLMGAGLIGLVRTTRRRPVLSA